MYKKAGLSGRNDLAAFFLEDLLLPASKGAEKSAEDAGVQASARVNPPAS